MKNYYYFLCAFCVVTLSSTLKADFEQQQVFSRLLNDPLQQEKFVGFVNEVIIKADGEKALKILKDAGQSGASSNLDFYSFLKDHKDEFVFPFYALKKLKALSHQKEEIHRQLRRLKPYVSHIDGYIEIGTPGTYIDIFREVFDLFGPVISINDHNSLSGYIQAYSLNPFNKFRPYDDFINVNNYDPISTDIASDSIDVISVFGGLHHIPKEKLLPFIRSIFRVLRPNGSLILREHDARTQADYDQAYLAHSIFNASMEEANLETEKNELRLFAPLSFWEEALNSIGFVQVQDVKILQKNDASLNTLVLFKKPMTNKEGIENGKNILRKFSEYERPGVNSYLSAPEWYNVDITDAYNDFIVEHPFYEFPFFSGANRFWTIFYHSLKNSIARNGFWDTVFSEYMMMDVFIGLMTTAEFYVKGLISLPLKIFFSDEEKTYRTVLAYDPDNIIEKKFSNINVLNKDLTTDLVTATFPRHRHLVKLLTQLQGTSLKIIEFSGHKYMNLKVRFHKIIPEELTNITTLKKLYEYEIPSRDGYLYGTYQVSIENLLLDLKKISDLGGELIHAYDF